MMTVKFSFVVYPNGATLNEAFEEPASRGVLKLDFKMVVVDGAFRHQAILSLQNDDGTQWTR